MELIFILLLICGVIIGYILWLTGILGPKERSAPPTNSPLFLAFNDSLEKRKLLLMLREVTEAYDDILQAVPSKASPEDEDLVRRAATLVAELSSEP